MSFLQMPVYFKAGAGTKFQRQMHISSDNTQLYGLHALEAVNNRMSISYPLARES